ncbi:MAG: class I SAM-dependent methyltransferase [Polyangia bacterium]
MGTQGTSREDGEIEFSSEELAEMQVDVAGREEAAGNKRKKRALRVPADEVPRARLNTEPDLAAIKDGQGGEADAVVDHAFSNGGRAEASVQARRTFTTGTPPQVTTPPRRATPPATPAVAKSAHEEKKDVEPERSVGGGKPVNTEAAQAIAKLAPNVRALMRALVPEHTGRIDSQGDLEQLDSAELVAEEPKLDSGEHLELESAMELDDREHTPSLIPAANTLVDNESADDAADLAPDISIDEAPIEMDAPPAAGQDEEEVAADDVTAFEIEEKPKARPPAMPPDLKERQRSVTPLSTPAISPALYGGNGPQIAPATPPLAPPPPPQGLSSPDELRPRRRKRVKQWFEEIFDDDYLRTLPFLSAKQTEREAAFVAESLELKPGSTLLDVGCGYGRHAMELAGRGNLVTGIDLSLPLLIRAADAARRIGVAVNFVHGDMREMTFDAEFDGAYSLFTSFGYFDDDTNRKVAANLQRALKPGGRVLIELVNRDYITRDLPTRVWWQGEGCVVLEEVDFNYFSSRLQVQRSIIFEDGRQLEQEISIRAYSLHEIGKVLHHAGFRVIEVSGGLGLRGKFFGAHSRQLIVLAEKKP